MDRKWSKLCFREVIFVFNVSSTLRKSWGSQHFPQLTEFVVIGTLALVGSALGGMGLRRVINEYAFFHCLLPFFPAL